MGRRIPRAAEEDAGTADEMGDRAVHRVGVVAARLSDAGHRDA